MQSLVNMGMIVPADYHECHKCTKTIAALEGPMYMRMGREKIPTLTSKDTPFEFGKAQPVASGTDGTIIGYGVMLQYCIMAAELLADEGIYPRVLNMATIKPLDVEALLEAAGETGGIVVAEEHSIYGALGSTVARVIAESDVLVPFKGVAIRDMYLSSGDPVELMDLAGLNVEGIVDALKDVLKRGKRG
jgi:transketolase